MTSEQIEEEFAALKLIVSHILERLKHLRVKRKPLPKDVNFARARKLVRAAFAHCYRAKSTYYAYYGAVGVVICDDWLNDRKSFIRYVAALPGVDPENGFILDLIERQLGYRPGNLVFRERVANYRKGAYSDD